MPRRLRADEYAVKELRPAPELELEPDALGVLEREQVLDALGEPEREREQVRCNNVPGVPEREPALHNGPAVECNNAAVAKLDRQSSRSLNSWTPLLCQPRF